MPDREIVTLDDYRQRYGQYREDPDLQAAHRQHPFIAIWDDHETANNSWSGGAQNHNPEEGDWSARRVAAVRAWREWMPVRESPGGDFRLYRQFSFGDLADLMMLDTRLEARELQVAAGDVAAVERANQTAARGGAGRVALRGPPRFDRGSAEALAASWPAGHVCTAGAGRALPPAMPIPGTGIGRRARGVFNAAAGAGVTASGGAHRRRAQLLGVSIWRRDPFDPSITTRAPAAGRSERRSSTPAVTSPGGPPADRIPALYAARPHLKFVAGEQQRGYVVLDLTTAATAGRLVVRPDHRRAKRIGAIRKRHGFGAEARLEEASTA